MFLKPTVTMGNLPIYNTKFGVFVASPQWNRWMVWVAVMWVAYILLHYALGPLTTEPFFSPALSVLFVFAVVINVLCVLTTCTDPGILPRMNAGEADPSGFQKESECQRPNDVLEFVNVAVANNNVIDQSMCYKCNHLKPRGANHCFASNACIMDMDHYCIILGCCIGSRNLRWFLLYLFAISIGGTLGIITTFKGLKGSAANGRHHDSVLLIFVTLLAIGGIAVGAVTYFFWKGMYLIWQGQTTRGLIKKIAVTTESKKGIDAIKQVMFPPIPSLLPVYFKDFFDNGDDDDACENDPLANREEM